MRKINLILLCSIMLWHLAIGQPIGTDVLGDRDRLEIPFKYNQGFMLVDVEIDKTLTLKFIFDTGAEHTILFQKIMADLIDLDYNQRIRILGSDISKDVHALIVRDIYIKFKKGETIRRDILVIEDEINKLRENLGEEISGILGTSMFKGMVVTIDYKKKKIILTHPKKFVPPDQNSGYKVFDLNIANNKAYLKTPVTFLSGNVSDAVLLIDTGAAIPLLLHTNTDTSMIVPEYVIDGRLGYGLGGPIQGFLGKIKKLDISPYRFDFVITSFQDIDLENYSQQDLVRNGIIGNKLLNRFKVIIDYFNGKLYLKPRRNYNSKFKYDMSGLELAALGDKFNEFEVRQVLKNSPAAEADIRPKDKIKKIGWFGTRFYSLERLVRKLESKEGRLIKLKIERDGKILNKRFRLRDLFSERPNAQKTSK